MQIIPRFLRQSTAPFYLGVSTPWFNAHVRPYLTEIRQEHSRALFFDRLELDEWADEYKSLHGKPGTLQKEIPCQKPVPVSGKGGKSGTSTKSLPDGEYKKARAKLNSKQQSVS